MRGIPNSGDKESECFPPALRFEVDQEGNLTDNLSDEPLAPDLTKESFSKVLVRLIAGIIDKPFDDLWNRETRRRVRRRLVGAGLGMLLAGVLLGYWYTRFANHVEYYSNGTQKWGIFEGIGSLSKEDVRRRNVSLKFYYKGYPGFGGFLEKVEVVDGNDQLNPIHNYLESRLHGWNAKIGNRRECRWIVKYGADGHPNREFAKNKFGTDILTSYITRYDKAPNIWYTTYEIEGAGIPVPSGARKLKTELDNHGFATRVFYIDDNRAPKAHPYGHFAEKMDFDERGFFTKRTYLGKDSLATLTKWGIASEEVEYDDNGNRVKIRYKDTLDSLTNHRDGYAIIENEYDAFGNLKEIRYLNREGMPTIWKEGYAIDRREYDDKGNLVVLELLDKDGHLTLNKQGYAKSTFKYDDFGHAIKITYFDKKEKPTFTKRGHHIVRQEFDKHGSVVKNAYFDVADNLILSKDGYAIVRFKYNSSGQEVERTHFGKWDEPIKSSLGYHKSMIVYDHRNRAKSIIYYDTSDNLVRATEDSVARREFKYHPTNYVSAVNFYDEHERPTTNKYGYSVRKLKYDIYGNIDEETYWDLAGKKTQHKDGYHKLDIKYDSLGNWPIVTTYEDTSSRATLHSARYWKVEREYDRIGNQLKESYFNKRNRRTMIVGGYSSVAKSYDDRGNIVDEKYLDVRDQLVENEWGFAIAKREYTNLDRIKEEKYLDRNERLVDRSDRDFARVKIVYDPSGNKRKETWFDSAGRLKVPAGQHYAKFEAQYDSLDKAITLTLWGTPEKSIPIRPKGIGMVESYKLTRTYDKSIRLVAGNLDGWTSETLFDSLSNIILRTKTDYDTRGNITVETFYDSNDMLTVPEEYGYAQWVRRFDVQDSLLIESTYSSSEATALGLPLTTLENSYKVVHTFGTPVKPQTSNFDKWTREVQFGADDNVLLRTIRSYDKRRNLEEQAFYDPDDRLIIPFGQSFARALHSFNHQNLIKEVTYFGTVESTLDTPFVSISCIKMTLIFDAPVKYTRDNLRLWTRAIYFDNIDRILLTERRALDSRGNTIERAFYDKNDHAMIHPRLGFAKVVANYDDQSLVKEITYFGSPQAALDAPLAGIACNKMTWIYDKPVELSGSAFWTSAINFDEDGRVLLITRRIFEPSGKLLEEACYDERDSLVIHPSFGYAKAIAEYDKSGRRIKTTYWATNQKPLRETITSRSDCYKLTVWHSDGKRVCNESLSTKR